MDFNDIRTAINDAVGDAARDLEKLLRHEVETDPQISTEMRDALLPLIGSRRSRDGTIKVGFLRRKSPRSRRGRSGVGIGSANVHWAVLGTADRYRDDGGFSGSMPGLDVVGNVSSTAERVVAELVEARLNALK